jgi:hypothetical protein
MRTTPNLPPHTRDSRGPAVQNRLDPGFPFAAPGHHGRSVPVPGRRVSRDWRRSSSASSIGSTCGWPETSRWISLSANFGSFGLTRCSSTGSSEPATKATGNPSARRISVPISQRHGQRPTRAPRPSRPSQGAARQRWSRPASRAAELSCHWFMFQLIRRQPVTPPTTPSSSAPQGPVPPQGSPGFAYGTKSSRSSKPSSV